MKCSLIRVYDGKETIIQNYNSKKEASNNLLFDVSLETEEDLKADYVIK